MSGKNANITVYTPRNKPNLYNSMSPSTLPVAMSSNGSTKSDENRNGIDEMKQKLKVQTGLQSVNDATYSNQAMGADDISRLFSDNAILKIWKTAVEHLTREVRT